MLIGSYRTVNDIQTLLLHVLKDCPGDCCARDHATQHDQQVSSIKQHLIKAVLFGGQEVRPGHSLRILQVLLLMIPPAHF